MNFTAAFNNVREMVSKRDIILQNVSSSIAEAVIDRQQNQGLSGQHKSNTITDIGRMIEPFSPEERERILTAALVAVASNGKFGAGSKKRDKSDSDDFSDMFRGARRK